MGLSVAPDGDELGLLGGSRAPTCPQVLAGDEATRPAHTMAMPMRTATMTSPGTLNAFMSVSELVKMIMPPTVTPMMRIGSRWAIQAAIGAAMMPPSMSGIRICQSRAGCRAR